MSEAAAKTAPPSKPKAAAKPKDDAANKDAPKQRRSKFESMYPEDAPITLLVEENPKKEGSAARERFQHYFSSKTVGDYLAAGGTYQDIAYDLGRQLIKIG